MKVLLLVFIAIIAGLFSAIILTQNLPTNKQQPPDVAATPLPISISYLKPMQLSSKEFTNNDRLPQKYTCQGQGFIPSLDFADIPEKTLSLALIIDDPDAPSGDFVHWLIWNLKPLLLGITENIIPEGVLGSNSAGQTNYYPPCPPSGTHRYTFKLYALDKVLNLEAGATKEALLTEMQGHILQQAVLIGLYSK